MSIDSLFLFCDMRHATLVGVGVGGVGEVFGPRNLKSTQLIHHPLFANVTLRASALARLLSFTGTLTLCATNGSGRAAVICDKYIFPW